MILRKRVGIILAIIGTILTISPIICNFILQIKRIDNYGELFSYNIKPIKTDENIEFEDTFYKKIETSFEAERMIKCLTEPFDNSEIPGNISEAIKKIKDYYDSSYQFLSYKYKDLYTGFTVSYNENQNVFAASTIKMPTDIYIYELAAMNKANLDETIEYTSDYVCPGSGIIQHGNFGTIYTVKKLLKYSSYYSDNVAHTMLITKYGRKNMLKFWQEKGTNAIFTQNGNWGINNAHDSAIYLEELFRFYNEDEVYGKQAMDDFLTSQFKFFPNDEKYLVAGKSGWTGQAIHDGQIVFAENPYIIVGMSLTGEGNYDAYFRKVKELTQNLHEEYWKYKKSKCLNIKT